MGNCLVTKLKESVDNNNLLKMGVLRLKNIGLSDFGINGNGLTVSVTDGGKIYTSAEDRTNNTNGVTQMSVSGTEVHMYFKSGTYDILINNKYGITKLAVTSSSAFYVENMRELKYCTFLSILRIMLLENPYLTDLSKMSMLQSLTIIPYSNFNGGGGDLANISTAIKNFNLPSGITVNNPMHLTRCLNLSEIIMGVTVTDKCSVESFVTGYVNNTRTTGSVLIRNAKNIFSTFYAVSDTISNNPYTYNTLEWDGTSKIIYKSGQLNYTDIKTIYEIGATVQEIADWKSSNITVIDASTGESV